MVGNDEVRFCSHCANDVHNLSEMTHAKAEKLIQQSNGKLCVRYVKTSEGKLMTASPKLTNITRRATIAASVLATSLAFSTLTYAQGEPIKPRDNSTQTNKNKSANDKSQGFSTISGTVMDANGAVVMAAKVTLLDTKTNIIRVTQTDKTGVYEFKKIETSLYELIVESPGFETLVVKDVKVLQETKLEKNLALVSGDVVGLLIVDDSVVTTLETNISEKVELRKLEELPLNSRKFTTMGLFPGVRSDEKAKKPAKPKKKKN